MDGRPSFSVAIPTKFSWTGGTPTASAIGSMSGIFVQIASHGVQGIEATVAIAAGMQARVYFGSYLSPGRLDVAVLDARRRQLAAQSFEVPAEPKAGGVGNGLLSAVVPATLTGADSLRVRWAGSRANGSKNLQLNAVAVSRREVPPCTNKTGLCTELSSCAGDCPAVDLDVVGDVTWVHGGVFAPPPPPPPPDACALPASLGGHRDLQIYGPSSRNTTAAWLATLRRWRTGCLAQLRLTGAIYRVPQLSWTQTAYFQPLMMPFDRYFYDDSLPGGGNYTVSRYLASLAEQYSGIDSILLWPTYTNIGVDDRNQFELTLSMPGGVAGIRAMVDELHAAGVQALWPYNPWDQGTHGGSLNNTQAGVDDAARLAALIKSTNADGFFGDTISSSGLQEFYDDAMANGHPTAIQPEGGGTEGSLNFTSMGWGYWSYPEIPPVDLIKYLEPRYLTQVCDRWSRDKTNVLQLAYFNGDGVETWQNIWGIWQGITARDGEALRRIGPVLRFFGRQRGFLQSPGWVPHDPAVLQQAAGVYGSAWPIGDETVWTLVNRGPASASGPQLAVGSGDARHYYDCYHGTTLRVAGGAVAFTVEAGGFGCVLATPNATLAADTTALLATMQRLTQKPLSSFSKNWSALPQTMVPIPPTKPHPAAPDGMVKIPAAANYTFAVSGVEIEGQRETPGPGDGVDVQFPWEPVATPRHRHSMAIPAFWIDKTPVTRSAYAVYLKASGYVPADPHNFLRNWTRSSATTWMYHPADAQKPVVHLSLREARAYCAFYGKRLPHTWEWQYAAQGTDGRPYPWGTDAAGAADGTRCPALETQSHDDQVGLAEVTAHPRGASQFGVLDLVGNVWQYTDEFRDEHTRAVLVRGGSHYYPSVKGPTSSTMNWYFPNGLKMRQLGYHGKYFLMSDTYERAGTVGFRCAAD